jgi:hypothetical protein
MAKQQKVKAAAGAAPSQGKPLIRFPSLDLRSLVDEARALDPPDADEAFNQVFDAKRDEQINELLRQLGLDRSDPDVWRKGFFRLAKMDHNVGRLSWRPRRTNRNPSTWTNDQNERLLMEVLTLRKKGLSNLAAIRQLARDPSKQALFPYRPHRSCSRAGEQKRREQALMRHWVEMRSGGSFASALRAMFEPQRSSAEAVLEALDISPLVAKLAPTKNEMAAK